MFFLCYLISRLRYRTEVNISSIYEAHCYDGATTTGDMSTDKAESPVPLKTLLLEFHGVNYNLSNVYVNGNVLANEITTTSTSTSGGGGGAGMFRRRLFSISLDSSSSSVSYIYMCVCVFVFSWCEVNVVPAVDNPFLFMVDDAVRCLLISMCKMLQSSHQNTPIYVQHAFIISVYIYISDGCNCFFGESS
jgi:hypothetical protein